jgi:hypothetical protein
LIGEGDDGVRELYMCSFMGIWKHAIEAIQTMQNDCLENQSKRLCPQVFNKHKEKKNQVAKKKNWYIRNVFLKTVHLAMKGF